MRMRCYEVQWTGWEISELAGLENLKVVGEANEEMLLISDDVYSILYNHIKAQNTPTPSGCQK